MLLELLVVFFGVYAAFALNTWREDRRAAEQRRQITSMIAEHIEDVSGELALVQPQLDSLLYRPFIEAQERGERPMPVPLEFTSGDVGVGLWEAAVQAGGLDVLDIQTLRDVQRYFARLQYLNNVAKRGSDLSDAYILPRLGDGPEAFYDASGALRPQYQWYPSIVAQLGGIVEELVAYGDSLHVRLDAKY